MGEKSRKKMERRIAEAVAGASPKPEHANRALGKLLEAGLAVVGVTAFGFYLEGRLWPLGSWQWLLVCLACVIGITRELWFPQFVALSGWYRAFVVLFAVVCIALLLMSLPVAGEPFPTTNLVINLDGDHDGRGRPLTAGDKAWVNIGVFNHSVGLAKNVRIAAQVRVMLPMALQTMESSTQEQLAANGSFTPPSDRPASTRGQFKTYFSDRTLTERDIEDIRADRLRLYVFTVLRYEDEKGEFEQLHCRYLLPNYLWATCGTNTTRPRRPMG